MLIRVRSFWSVVIFLWSVSFASQVTAREVAVVDIVRPAHETISMIPFTLTNVPSSRRDGVPKVSARDMRTGRQIPCCFIPDLPASSRETESLRGTLLIEHGKSKGPFAVFFVGWGGGRQVPPGQPFAVSTRYYALQYDPARAGGFPSAIVFHPSGLTCDNIRWNDRVYRGSDGGYWLQRDPSPSLSWVAETPSVKVLRVIARYCPPDGSMPPSAPFAAYDWYFFTSFPLLCVVGQFRQRESAAWDEMHFLEINLAERTFPEWLRGEPVQRGAFTASQRSFSGADWGAFINGRSVLALLRGGQPLFHDGHGAYGTYLHAFGDRAWQPSSATATKWTAWLLLGSFSEPVTVIRRWKSQLPDRARASVSSPEVWKEMHAGKGRSLAEQRRLLIARSLNARGMKSQSLQVLKGTVPSDLISTSSGPLTALFLRKADGLSLIDLLDVRKQVSLLSRDRGPLFRIHLTHLETGQTVALTSDADWESVAVVSGVKRIFLWRQPRLPHRLSVTVKMVVTCSPAGFVSADLLIDNEEKAWSVWTVEFPVLRLGDWLSGGKVLVPDGPGRVWSVSDSSPRYSGRYPGFNACLQYFAAYTVKRPTVGFYVAHHDPYGSVKDLTAQTDDAGAVVLLFSHPAPDMRKGGNDFDLPGEVVLGLFTGDWYDATQIYRRWALTDTVWVKRARARRISEKSPMAPICAWALASGDPKEVVSPVETFATALNVPTAVHWYNWHQIPFDNDYPHYFPTREGFREGVIELQKKGIAVMPYINGRLWDTRDRRMEDFRFSLLALPSTTKTEDGKPYIETYGSKEEDGSPVRLAPMCPSTALWRETVKGIVDGLFKECQVKGVYIDQVAAANPVLCFDRNHPHPLGGGSWWNRAYWKMLDEIRVAMTIDRFLTTECNAEPFIGSFDGYLTWHWQLDGQVPAFPAVYSPYVILFGRAYRGGTTKDLALRMKAGQQLVFGEQIGWIDPAVAKEAENIAFLRQVVQARQRFSHFFTEGEMLRPPQVLTSIPTVRADWQWAGEWWVTTPALLTGAWFHRPSRSVMFLFVNVSDQGIKTVIVTDASRYPELPKGGTLRIWTSEKAIGPYPYRIGKHLPVRIAPRSVGVWVFTGSPK